MGIVGTGTDSEENCEVVANGLGIGPSAVGNPHEQFGERLKQTLAMLFCLWTLIVAPFCILSIFLLFGFYALLWPFAGLYLAWFLYDFKTPCQGSRFSESIHNWPLWRHMANYFPVEVHKTAPIPPEQNYLFCAHPHGVLGSSSMLFFSSGATKTRKLFPGIKLHGATLAVNFWFPIRREFFMSLGIISCCAESIEFILGHPKKGNAVGVVPGGAAEALESIPGKHRVILANRKGFVKLAIKHGAWLVPVYHFGETSLYQQIPTAKGTFVRKYQELVKRLTSVSFPFAYGQNILASLLPAQLTAKLPWYLTVGLLPFRHRVVTVVGAPMPVEKEPEPSQERIDAVHAEYCARLRQLFDEHKTRLGRLPESAELEIL